jgi:hypothetical protein
VTMRFSSNEKAPLFKLSANVGLASLFLYMLLGYIFKILCFIEYQLVWEVQISFSFYTIWVYIPHNNLHAKAKIPSLKVGFGWN